jgi:crotonobetainyl-CoA:carnitine CoA-transferase CaiB-like acyl-CoA transferase
MAGMMLADQGAEVIKVEPPLSGDGARFLGPSRGGMSALFATLNRNKKSLALDLKCEAENEIFLRLVETADVLLENYRPGVINRLGLGYERLREINPRLVFASISGYGQDGPYENRRVYDPLIQATTGTVYAQGGEVPKNVRTIIFDKVTALTTAQGITAALLERARTGLGQYVPVAMVEAALSYQWPDVMWSHVLLGEGVSGQGELADWFPIFRAKDGFVSIILVADTAVELLSIWRGAALHLDPRFQTLPARIENMSAFVEAVEAILADITTDEICTNLDAFGIPVARANSLSEVHADEQIQHLGSLVETEHPAVGAMRLAKPPIRFGGHSPSATEFPERPAPALGQDSRELLAELGVGPDKIEELGKRDATNAALIAAALANA